MLGETVISILRRLIDSSQGDLSPEAAQAVLHFRFSESDQARMAELAARNTQGALTSFEAEEYDGYIAAADLPHRRHDVIDPATRALVVERAGHRCEYCQLPQAAYEATFNIDHIIASQHRRDDDLSNLALSCPKCNRKKGPNLAGIDPLTNALIPLFNPRQEAWSNHFRWSGAHVLALTPTGRTTIAVLELNGNERVALRQSLIVEGMFPPSR